MRSSTLCQVRWNALNRPLQRIGSINQICSAGFTGAKLLYSSVSSSNAAKKSPSSKSSASLNSLKRVFDAEIAHESEQSEMEPEADKESKAFLEKGGWKLDTQDGNAIITLSAQRDGIRVNVLLDARQIYADENRYEDEDYDEEYNASESKEEDVDDEFDEIPLSSKVELINSSNPSSKITMEVMLFEDHLEVNSLHHSSSDTPLNFSTDQYLTPQSNVSPFTTPSYYDLSEDVHEAVEKYLQNIGLDKEMYSFLSEYIYVKEASEYTRWLKNVRNFFN